MAWKIQREGDPGVCLGGQTEFAVYRHRPHGFSDFLRFQIQYSKYTGLGRILSSALISGRGSGNLELEHVAILVSLIV